MIGRVLRPADGKTDAIVLDHSGAVFRHGFVEDPVEWTLDPDRRAESPAHAARCEHYASRLLECSQCGAVRVAGEPCGHCGFLPQRPPQVDSQFEDGELGQVGRDRRVNPNLYDPELRNALARHARCISPIERGYKPGWAAHKYKEKFGAWPPWGARPQPIAADTRGPLVGALAADRLREVEERGMKPPRKNRISGQWSPRPIEMLESPAYRTLSLSAHRVISRIEIELARHGGHDNGRLPVTKQAFIAFGVHNDAVAPAIREAEALGFIRVTERGRGGNSEHRKPNLFRVTFAHGRNSQSEPPKHDWRRIKTIEEAIAVARAARAAKSRTAVSIGKRAARKIEPGYENRTYPLGYQNRTRNSHSRGPENRSRGSNPRAIKPYPLSIQLSILMGVLALPPPASPPPRTWRRVTRR